MEFLVINIATGGEKYLTNLSTEYQFEGMQIPNIEVSTLHLAHSL